ncbi:MAG: GreA/GreB family elongation factor [Acidobacteria bacterium]|nr:GreA/GreB family elongation factor [Acidobacteriota bacterium]MCA1612393.1 GreA/GreB family elongation factor [Acidobacteriota bacterium]
MPTSDPNLPEDIASLIEHKKFPELEDRWIRLMEVDSTDLPLFFSVASAVKRKGNVTGAVGWLRLLADELGGKGDRERKLKVLLEIARIAPTDPAVRPELESALKERFAGHPSLAAVLAKHPVVPPDPAGAAGKVERWLQFAPGQIHFLPGRGPGRIVEMNPGLDVLRLEIAGTRLPLSLVSAERTLTRLPEGHFLRDRLERPEEMRALAASDPSETVRRLLASFGRALTVSEIKEHLSGLVDESRWTSFWTAAKKHPQLLVAGAARSARVSWSDSAASADDSIRAAFHAADPRRQIDLARKNGKRSKDLAREFAGVLSARASAAAEEDPALAWELSQAAARLVPGEAEAFDREALAAAGDPGPLLLRIHDSGARERALEALRGLPRWSEIFADQFHREDDSRVLTFLYRELAAAPEKRDEIVRRILRSPRLAPRAFVWLCDRIQDEELPAPPGLFLVLVDALRQDEFSGLRSRLKEFFEPGGLAVRLVRGAAEPEARDFLAALTRASGLEEHRRSVVRDALLMAYPELRAPAVDYLYGTAQAIEGRRKELTHLKQVELPANAEAMRTAKEHGDLRENFEYQSARQKHEYLSARIAALSDELSRTRALDPARIDVSEVRVGTRVRLRELDGGAERVAVILGPWDSKPEENVYSYQSEFAQGLLGRRPGERVGLSGTPAEIVSIEPWTR